MMLQERLAAAQGYLQRQDIAAAQAQCEEVLRADAQNNAGTTLLSQIAGRPQRYSGSLPQERGSLVFNDGYGDRQ